MRVPEVWNLSTSPEKLAASFETSSSAITRFSPDSKWLIVGDTKNYRVWDVRNWDAPYRTISRAQTDQPGPIAVSPNGKFMAGIVGRGDLRLYTFPDCELITRLASDDRLLTVHGLNFSNDGKYLAVAAVDEGLQVWNLEELKKELNEFGINLSYFN